MDWLKNWDDLIHGTAVFGAAVPFCLGLILGCMLIGRLWIALLASMAPALIWLFGQPNIPPQSSDDALICGLGLVAILIGLESFGLARTWRKWVLRLLGWLLLAWFLYPAWLAAEGGATRKLIVSGIVGLSILFGATALGLLTSSKLPPPGTLVRISLAAWIPFIAGLSALLQLGGSTQFAQSAGAMASGMGAICVVLLWKKKGGEIRPTAAAAGMMFGLMAWSGYLFAEIHVGALFLLLATPLAASASHVVPLPRRSLFFCMLWELIPAAIVSALAVWIAWQAYRGSGDSMGY